MVANAFIDEECVPLVVAIIAFSAKFPRHKFKPRSHNMVIYDSLSDKLSGVLVLAEC